MMNALYGAGTYAKGNLTSGATSSPNSDSSAIIYDHTKFTLINEALVGTPSTSGMPRQEIRYQFRPVGYGANADFYVYVGHWKASGSASDMAGRNVEAQTIRASANGLTPGSRILYVGDFNLTGGTSEAAWSTITASGTGQGIDPLGGSWANIAKTWSTTSLGSRLDFQMQTQPTNDGHGFSLIAGTYHTFANNGTTPGGSAANNGSNSAVPGLPNRAGVLNALTTASDHYPVVADYRYPAKMGVDVSAVPAQVIVGANVPVDLTVTNTAPALVAAGADVLDYSYSGTGAISGSGAATGLPALAPGNVHSLALDTATPGMKSGTVDVNSTSQEVADGSASPTVSTTVLAHASGSFAADVNQNALEIDFGIRARGSTGPEQEFAVHNRADVSGFTAGLDVDAINAAGDTAQLATNAATFTNLAADSSNTYVATMTTASVGSFTATYSFDTSDQDLPGATPLAPLTLTLTGRVALGGDANLDNTVNLLDFNILAGHFNTSGAIWQTADFNADAVVNLLDFNILAANFNMTATGIDGQPTPQDWANLAAAVPEPGSALLCACVSASAAMARRRRARTRTR